MSAAPLHGKTLRPEDLTGPLAVLTGTRPGIIKFSPILRELDRRAIPYTLIHSGQHYSPEMDAVFFEELGLRAPDYKLDVVRHYPLHGEQTAEMLKGIERALIEQRSRLLLVGGDCNTHLAGALAARKLHIPIGHVEAGMRSDDWRMPEEHNRVIIDHISEHLFVHEESAARRLEREGVRGDIYVVGSTIADAVASNVTIARQRSGVHARLGIRPKGYVLATIHREENVDDGETIGRIFTGLDAIGSKHDLPIIFPTHPRTRKQLAASGIDPARFASLHLIEPQGYLDFLLLLADARAMITDSGGVQQEACILGVPCVTIRQSTEWTETIGIGANRLADPEPARMLAAADAALSGTASWQSPFERDAAARLIDIVERLTATQGREE